MDTYKVRHFDFPNMKVNVFIPELTPEERERRMAAIHKAAANLLSGRKN
jgi:hypothetical protein